MTMAAVITSKADLNDQRWLDERVGALRDGIEAARDIWLNWTEIRNVSRLAGGQSYGDFIASRLGFRLAVEDAIKALPGASPGEIAKVAGVHRTTVMRQQEKGVQSHTLPDQPTTVLGADGKSYPARVVRTVEAEVIEPDEESASASDIEADLRRLLQAIEAIDRFAQAYGPVLTVAAMSDPTRRAVGARVRRAHSFLGRLSVELKGDN